MANSSDRTRNVLVRLADQPVAMLPAELAMTRRVVRDVVVAVHPHGRQHVDARLVELPRDLRQRPPGALDQAVEVLVQPVVPHVLEVLVPVPRALPHLRFVLVRLAVADAPRHSPDGRAGIGVDHELLDRLRRHSRGHVAQDPSVVVADDLSVLACHGVLPVACRFLRIILHAADAPMPPFLHTNISPPFDGGENIERGSGQRRPSSRSRTSISIVYSQCDAAIRHSCEGRNPSPDPAMIRVTTK